MSGQGNFNEEIYLLGLSNLIPTHKLLKRLAKINPKWDCSKDDPYVKQYLDQESDAEDKNITKDASIPDNFGDTTNYISSTAEISESKINKSKII